MLSRITKRVRNLIISPQVRKWDCKSSTGRITHKYPTKTKNILCIRTYFNTSKAQTIKCKQRRIKLDVTSAQLTHTFVKAIHARHKLECYIKHMRKTKMPYMFIKIIIIKSTILIQKVAQRSYATTTKIKREITPHDHAPK